MNNPTNLKEYWLNINNQKEEYLMTPRERAIAALERRQPDKVPHFELEMQLTEEYFKKKFSSKRQWDRYPAKHKDYLRKDAELLLQIAERFDYCIIFYSFIHRPTFEVYLEGLRILREMDGGKHLLMAHGDSTMSIPDGNIMMQLVKELFEEPNKVKHEQEESLSNSLRQGKQLLQAGLDGFILCSDYCFNQGPFLSPKMFDEFVTPYLTRLTKGYRDMGAYVIKHTDGNIMPILDQLVSTQPHALHSLDPMAGIDMKVMKEKVGNQLCLIGNVNCALMQTGTDEEILNSCRYAMQNGKPGGGYIFSTSNVIFKGMPQRSYDLMLEYYRNNNQY